nr:MAG TPA: hypothetical protein [Caudoviricetes sp.]
MLTKKTNRINFTFGSFKGLPFSYCYLQKHYLHLSH